MTEANESRSSYLLKLAGRSLGIEGYRFGMQAYNEAVGHAQKTITLTIGARAHGVICGISSFIMPSLSEAIFHNKLTDQELDLSVSTDLATTVTALIAAGMAGTYTRNVWIGITTYLASRAMLNAITHIGHDLLHQTNLDGGLS